MAAIGRAQAMQGRAARVEPVSDMNPILLKPEANGGAQVIVQGRATTLSARDYFANRDRFRPAVLESFQRLAATADLVVVEGAGLCRGQPAGRRSRQYGICARRQCSGHPHRRHPSWRRHRIAGRDIRGPRPSDAALIRAFLVNNFHGDPSLFDDGRKFIESRTGVPCLGVIPHWNDARKLPAEDSLALDNHRLSHEGPVRIAVLRLARIANFDDLDLLMLETSITVEFVQPGAAAGARRRRDHSRNQIDDRRSALPARAGLDTDIRAHLRRGGRVLGLCGGYQMLGRRIHDCRVSRASRNRSTASACSMSRRRSSPTRH